LENVIIKFVADTSGLKPAIDQLQLLGKISEADAASFAKINDEQKEFIQNLNKSTTEFGKLNSEVEGLMAEIQAGVMEGFADHLAEVTAETKKAGTGFKSMKAELRELKAQIASGSLGEKELREATKRAAELQDTIGDVSDKVKALASDTKRIDAVVTAFRGVAAAASVAAGAAALFGNENEKLTKTLAQAQGAMALLQGVQELANIATTEGALRTMALDAAQKVAAVSSRALGVTITASMAAATAGVSLIVAALVYFVSTLDDAESDIDAFNKKVSEIGMDEGSRANSKLRVELMRQSLKDEEKARLDALNNRNKRESQIQNEYRKDVLALDAAFNELSSEDKILANSKYQSDRKKIEEKANADLKLIFRAYSDDIAAIDKAIAENKEKTSKKIIKTAEKTNKEEERLLEEWRKRREQLMEEMAQASLDMALAESEDKINARKKDMEDFDRDILLRMEKQKAANDAELESLMALMSKTTAARKVSTEEWSKFAIDQAQVVSDTIFTINQNRQRAETESQLNALNTQREAELNNKNLTDAQRLQIEKRYAEQERAIKQRAYEADKAAAIAQAIINGALAVSKAWATVPPPANVPAAIAAGVATAAQIAVIQSTPIPQFADGTEFLVGKGTGRSDDNLAWLSHGERVVPAGINSDYFPALSAIQNRDVEPTFANNILTALANGTFDLAAQFQGKQQQADQGFDYDKLGKVLARNKSSVNIQMDEAGYTKYLIKENSKVQFRNTKLRLKN